MPPISINIFFLKINAIENASAINIGQNYLSDWTNSDKRNQGFGQNYGDESGFFETRSFVDDKDLIDAPSQKITMPPAKWVPFPKEV